MSDLLQVTPSSIHPSHDVREEGWLISEPVCQHCRVGVEEVKNTRLLLPCPRDPARSNRL